MKELDDFLANWPDTAEARTAFAPLKAQLEVFEGMALDFIARPGITYSMRVKHAAQPKRELFVMVDGIEDDPRWLSVCFDLETAAPPASPTSRPASTSPAHALQGGEGRRAPL